MRKIFCIFFVLLMICSAKAADEIVIEMQGDSFSSLPAPSLWQKDAKSLCQEWRGKTRDQVLYSLPIVSSKDRIVRGPNTKYALVEYYEQDNFRKFLFKAEDPQTFITAAANAADVLAINKKYGINIGLKQTVFEDFYKDILSAETDPILPPQNALYRLSYTDINTPKATPRWFLFEKQQLTFTFETETEKENYLSSLRKKAEVAKPKPQPKPQPKKRTAYKALLSGGTVQDQMYMPRVTKSKFLPIQPTDKKEN